MKKTKSALLSSVVSLILCFAMLLSTTFAWFTDSVTSANNIIKSGNLDIELEYWNGTAWVDVAGKSDILTNTLWEPGVTEVAYLRVANAGSLALKYQLGINIVSETAGVNADGDEFLLSDYIQFGVVELDAFTTYASREAAVEAVGASKKISAGYTKPGTLYPADNIPDDVDGAASELYLALVVYMPTEVGNVANHDGTNIPEINLGINVFATQMAAEDDSFGTDYDEGATVEVYTAADLQAALNTGVQEITLVENITVNEPIVIPASATAAYSLRSVPVVTVDLNGKTLTGEIIVSAGANAKIINGKIVSKNPSNSTIESKGNLTLSGLTVDSMRHAVRVEGGVTVIESGKYKAAGYAGRTQYAVNVSDGGEVVINGGTFIGPKGYCF